MDDLDRLRATFGDNAVLVHRALQELYGEMSTSEALEHVLTTFDKRRMGLPLDDVEQRISDAMDRDIDDQTESAILTRDVDTSLGRVESGARVKVVARRDDGTVLVSAGISPMVFPVSESSLVRAS